MVKGGRKKVKTLGITIIIMLLFSQLSIKEVKDGIPDRVYIRIESPVYRYISKDGITTDYWSRFTRSMDF